MGKDKPTNEDLLKQLEQLKAENEALKAKRPVRSLTMKVSEKGALSVYGLTAKWPVTLYKEQWIRLLAIADDIKKFIVDNDSKLKGKE